ncbi:MAG TPA: hypothetical protein VLA06_01930 [Woeseiaceae bacterium]|jgi:hypothetical protein|nr:hypothetical protein [Woeseiaceae bacterium]
MRNLLLILLLANILYFVWGMFSGKDTEPGVAVVSETDLGPPMEVIVNPGDEMAASVGAMLGSGEPSALAAVVGRSCASVGPFKLNSDAEEAQMQYSGEGMRASVRATTGQIFVGHWVIIRGIEGSLTTSDMLDSLHGGGLPDAYPVPQDDGTTSISLGLFGELDGAEKVELQAKSLGLPAEIVARTRDDKVFFVDIALPPGKGAGAIVDKYGEDRVLLRDAATCPQSQ